MHTFDFLTCVAGLLGTAFADFGLTTSDSTYTIDTSGGLIFEVNRTNNDITSLLYNGVQFQGTGKMSQINSGLGTSIVTANTNVGVWMIMPGNAYEHSAGGPFMRDINSQSTGDQELCCTKPPPADDDMTFFDSLNIDGYVPDSGRGSVSGTATGAAGGSETVVRWFSQDAQYCAKAAGGNFNSPLMKPGTYKMKMYRNEFPVANASVTVTVGVKATQDIMATESEPSVIWRIGEFEGQPFELKNGDKIQRMHPSDARMTSWGGEFTVGSSKNQDFPMALFSKIGGNGTVNFNLAVNQLEGVVLRIGTMLSFKGRKA
ncbi:rhamnogalacturonase B [Colletotrichum salicis]|uniref:rhamnogalacturonan endolyase n=1 Tax=Colletotrichum salicis TaxID=1209931 RepID=A0A135RTL0_9PEZI|nr:rhamnogalacturonase B [Colletotrichum salicis]